MALNFKIIKMKKEELKKKWKENSINLNTKNACFIPNLLGI